MGQPTVIALGIAAWFVQEGLSRRKSSLLLETSGSPPLAPAARKCQKVENIIYTTLKIGLKTSLDGFHSLNAFNFYDIITLSLVVSVFISNRAVSRL